MSIVNFTSGINNIEHYTPLSEWAVNFIFTHKLTRENFNSNEGFRVLSRREKDAIRYQIRKGVKQPSTRNSESKRAVVSRSAQTSPTEVKVDRLRLAKLGLGIWISGFLLIDVANVYLNKGASPLMAWQSAILVELCIVCASMSSRADLRRIAYALFIYNILIFGLMEVDAAFRKTKAVKNNLAKVEGKEERLRTLKQQLIEQAIASKDNLKRLGLSHQYGYITSGTNSFEIVSKTLKDSSENIKNEISSEEEAIKDLQERTHTSFWIYISAALYFLLRCILQFFSIRLLGQKDNL
ncbi:MAG: hypothetical protein R3A80_10095 [Bdellovibrionota bacterium]